MKKATSVIRLLICINIIQLFIIGACFYIFSSKIKIIPWYAPLTSYILLNLIILFIAEILMIIYIWFMWEKYTLFKLTMIIACINVFIILFMFFISIASIMLFNVFAIIYTFLELLLFIRLVYSTRIIIKTYK